MRVGISAGLVALGLFAACEAGAQNAATPPAPTAPPAPPSGFRFTQIFSQFNLYDTASSREELSYRYSAYGFSTGAGFAWGRTVTGYVYGGYMYATDRVSSPTPSETIYHLPQFGGSLRHEFMPNLFVGSGLVVQPIFGRFESENDRGAKRGWSISASPFLSATIPLRPFFIDITGQFNLSRVSVDQPGPSDGFIGSTATASVSVAARYAFADLFSIGVSVTPGWVLAESDRISNRGNGPFFIGFGGNAAMQIAGPLKAYGSYTYRLHRSDRSAHVAVFGLAWALGR